VIVLIGFMGAGKTTVGRLLASRLGLPFADTDVLLEQRAGRPIREIFAAAGEPGFRALEHQVTAERLAGPEAVLALGGGGVQHPATQRALGGHHVVYLEVGYAESMDRVGRDELRPMLGNPGLEEIFRQRLAGYRAVAAHTVSTDGRPPDAVCQAILDRLPQVTDIRG
jgi:shikimate kinase